MATIRSSPAYAADRPGPNVIVYRLGPPPPGRRRHRGRLDRRRRRRAGHCRISELAIPGRHNVSNALAAVSVGLHFGIAPDAIRRAAAAFAGVEHRLEPVAIIDGVRFVNDSQGTQPDAVIAALRAFDPPIVLIAGGRDKGVDLSALAPVVAERAAAAVLIGESGPALEAMFRAAGLEQTRRPRAWRRRSGSLTAWRARMREAGDPHATVLLSPAAASFDMFEDYAARGRAFKEAVGRLGDERRQEIEG